LPEGLNTAVVKYTLLTVFFNKGIQCCFVKRAEQADLTVGISGKADIKISANFFSLLDDERYNHREHLSDNGKIMTSDGTVDYLSTIFYLTNSIQEYQSKDVDEYGRFRYINSVQHKFNWNEANVVQQLLDEMFAKTRILSEFQAKKRKSRVFLTHDIDSVYGALAEDGFYALKKLQAGQIFRLLLNTVTGKPDWLNMDRIMNIEDEYGLRSTFYWLLLKDQENSDYNFRSNKIQTVFKNIKTKGWENGLHKAIGNESFEDEIELFGSKPEGNRFHFLKFALPGGYEAIESSGILLDTSLGFSEVACMRNSYGLPVMPYNLKQSRVYNFIEVPQMVMDRTFFRDRKPVSEIKKELIGFFEKNKHNCVFTINWHNNFFTELKYRGYTQLYRELLLYFKENEVAGITQSELINEYYQPAYYTAGMKEID
jgi:hypothetical protein